MKILVDADACPKAIKEILFRAADRAEIYIVFVANQIVPLNESTFISSIQVEQGADVADDKIVEECKAGDLIITADIPLAARVVAKNATALDPRGTLYDKSNIGSILSMRNFMDSLRSSGVETGGMSSFSHKECLKFANALDRFIINKCTH